MRTYIEELQAYKPFNDLEKSDLEMMLHIVKIYGDKALSRDNLTHFSSSSMILNQDHAKVLMVYHNIYKSYSWTGGHMDNNPYPLEVAIKEAKEETGIIDLKLLNDNLYSIEIIPVKSHIKNNKTVSSHLHLNFTYLFEANDSQTLKIKQDENKDVKWININALENYISSNDIDMIPIYRKVLREWKTN